MAKDQTVELKHEGKPRAYLEHFKGTQLFQYWYNYDILSVPELSLEVPEIIFRRTQQIMKKYGFPHLSVHVGEMDFCTLRKDKLADVKREYEAALREYANRERSIAYDTIKEVIEGASVELTADKEHFIITPKKTTKEDKATYLEKAEAIFTKLKTGICRKHGQNGAEEISFDKTTGQITMENFNTRGSASYISAALLIIAKECKKNERK